MRELFNGFRLSLTATFGLLVFVVLVACMGTLYFVALSNIRDATIVSVAHALDESVASAIHGIERQMFVPDGPQPRELRRILEDIQSRHAQSSVTLHAKSGLAAVASPDITEGRTASVDSRDCMICHRHGKPSLVLPVSQRMQVWEEDGIEHLSLVQSVPARETCFAGACHAQDRHARVLGDLTMRIPLSRFLHEASVPVHRAMLVALAVMFMGMVVVTACLSLRLTRPYARIMAALRGKAAGEPWNDIDMTGAGELRELVQNVNIIADHVRQRQQGMDEHLSMYQSLFDGVPCLITVQDRNLRLIRYNNLFSEHFGAKPVEHCFKIYKGRDVKCVNCPVEKTFQDGKSHSTEEKGFYKDGTPAYWIVKTAPIRGSDGEVTAVMEMCLDITERKGLEEKLRKSERTYSTIFDNIPVAVFELNAKTLEVCNCNRKMSQLYGYCKGEVIGKPFAQLFAHDHSGMHIDDMLHQKRISQSTHVDKDGKEFFVSIDVSRTHLNGDEIILAVVTDVTDRIRAEQQVIQSSKMATLGEMAAGVAHELNQPLAVLKMVANYFARKSKRNECLDADELRHMTDKIVNNVDRATKIIEHMREFGRKPNLESVTVQVNAVLQRACDFFSEQLKIRDILINWELDADQPPVLADPNRLEQVFINLLVNARDAIEDKCSAKECTQGDRIITLRTRSNARHVVAEVIDTGPGIPKDVVARIFEPFFSTKEVGRGTGLGLSICYDIVTDYDGTIHVFSKPGGGARFVVSLPIADLVRSVSS
jgi:histidine kinase